MTDTRTCPLCGLEADPATTAEHAERTHAAALAELEARARAPRPDAADKLAAHLTDTHGYAIIDLGPPPGDEPRRPAMRRGGYL
jgi:hypothetical protein